MNQQFHGLLLPLKIPQRIINLEGVKVKGSRKLASCIASVFKIIKFLGFSHFLRNFARIESIYESKHVSKCHFYLIFLSWRRLAAYNGE